MQANHNNEWCKNLQKNLNQPHDVPVNILRKELAEDFKYKSGITSLLRPKMWNKLNALYQHFTLQIYTYIDMHVLKKNVGNCVANLYTQRQQFL